MSDYEAIQTLMARYTNAINRRDFDAMKELFAADGVWDIDAGDGRHFRFEGDEIGSGIGGILKNSSFVAQLASLPVIEIDGDQAHAQCTLFEVGEQPGRGVRFENFGLYDDNMRKLNGKWVFQTRRFTMKNSKITPLQK